MKKLAVVLLLLAIGAAVVAVVLPRQTPTAATRPGAMVGPAHGRKKAEWEPYGYQCRPAPKRRRYNLPVLIEPAGHEDPNVRLLLDMRDPAKYYFVELTKDTTRIGKVESGLEAEIGTGSRRGLSLEGENKVVLKRRHHTLTVVLNDSVAARAEDEAFHGGKVGAGVLDGSAVVRFGTPQPCDPIYLGDDFMQGASEGGVWTSVTGSWKTAEIRNPSLSSNAFFYTGSTHAGQPPAVTVRGQWFWDDYRLRVACASFGTDDVGILFYHRDDANTYLFRWNAGTKPDGSDGRRQLIKRWHGEETVLAEAPGGYQQGVWYELEVEAVGGRIRAFIDGRQIFSVADGDLCFGRIGLYSAVPSPQVAHFDDVLLQTVRGFEDGFATVAARRWQPLGGDWEQRADGDRHYCFLRADEPAKAVAGSVRWRDYTASTTLRLPPSLTPQSEVGVVAHYLDEMNYALFAWKPGSGTARLEGRVDGERVALEQIQAPQSPAATSHRLELVCDRGILTARLDDQAITSAWVPGLAKGRVGLYGAGVAGLAFDRMAVRFPLPPEPVLTTNEVFTREHTMQIWAGAAQDWEDTSERIGSDTVEPHWHRADFFGATTIEAEIKDDAAKATGPRSCRLVVSAENIQTVQSGYNFVLAWPAEGPPQAVLTRGAQVVANKAVEPDGAVRRLRLRRQGSHVIAAVNELPILHFKDPSPLAGSRAAYATTSLPIPRTDVSVFSDNVKVYTFSRASSDWRAAEGRWEVTNRWECDPRWSFFSGMPGSQRLACIWNKLAFEGDVTVEFAVGPKMVGARGGSSYKYARDFNVTICADGKDLSSGYSFLFGGWNNARSGILRGNKLLAPSSAVILRSSSIHRKWYYVKAEKRGNTLSFYVDGSRIATAQDPQPLTGTRVAIWTYDCDIMVSRVRIAASRIGPKEPPGPVPGPCRTIYSMGQ